MKCTENVIKLEKYNDNLDDGKPPSGTNRKATYELIGDCHKIMQRSKELLAAYDGNDAPVFKRKMNNIAERLEDVSTNYAILEGFRVFKRGILVLELGICLILQIL